MASGGGYLAESVDILVRKPPLISRACETKGGFSYKRLAYTKTTEVPLGNTIACVDDPGRRKMVFSAAGAKILRFESTKCISSNRKSSLVTPNSQNFRRCAAVATKVDYTTAKSL